MNITLNNRPEEFRPSSVTVADLLKLKKFSFKLLVVKINGRLIKKDEFNHAIIKDGDVVSVIHLISGG